MMLMLIAMMMTDVSSFGVGDDDDMMFMMMFAASGARLPRPPAVSPLSRGRRAPASSRAHARALAEIASRDCKSNLASVSRQVSGNNESL
jgi:hypothetical protein